MPGRLPISQRKTDTHKWCPRCQSFLKYSAFHPKAVARSGRACRNCLRKDTSKYRIANPEKCREFVRRADGPQSRLFRHAKDRAKEAGVPFAIRREDIVIPEWCPILGLRLARGIGRTLPASPTLDRIIPALGYVPGNIAVMSHKANRLKSDGSVEDLAKVLLWLLTVALASDKKTGVKVKPLTDVFSHFVNQEKQQ